MRQVAAFVIAAVLAFAGCSEETPTDPMERAMAYGEEQSGGETTGCTSAEPGEEAEGNAGCIYSAALAGCYAGITGEELGPMAPDEEFPEPGLREVYDQGVDDCSEG